MSTGGWDCAADQWLNIYYTAGNPDPLKAFGVTWHDYPGWTRGSSFTLEILAAGYPLVITETHGFDANLNGVGHWTTAGAGISEAAGYAFASANDIGYVCGSGERLDTGADRALADHDSALDPLRDAVARPRTPSSFTYTADRRLEICVQALDCHGVPNEIRTRVTAVKGRCPRPLDDGDAVNWRPPRLQPPTAAGNTV
jgi:hypothetical protein